MNNTYFDSYGLVNARKDEDCGENAILYTYEYYLLLLNKNKDEANKVLDKLFYAVDNSYIKWGLYKQNPKDTGPMSHDQLTTIMCLLNKHHCIGDMYAIWDEIGRQNFRYDNLNPIVPSWKRILHPRDIIFYGILAGNWLCYLLSPLLIIMMLFSVYNNETSGKLLWWIRINSFDGLIKEVLEFIFDLTMFYKYGNLYLQKTFSIYFPDMEHPINLVLKE